MKRESEEDRNQNDSIVEDVIYKKLELDEGKQQKIVNQEYLQNSSTKIINKVEEFSEQKPASDLITDTFPHQDSQGTSNQVLNQKIVPINQKDIEIDQNFNGVKISRNQEREISQQELQITVPQQTQSLAHLDSLKMQYLNEKNLKKLVELCQPYPQIYREFAMLKYKNKIYSLNEFVLIQNADDLRNDFIGQLIKIIRIEKQEQYITLIQIKWYYKKDDLPRKFDSILDCISDNEIFETDHVDITFVDCINGHCRLYSYQDYDGLISINTNTFYTRAKYDTIKKKLIPPFENWDKGCICKKPLNPDYLYIQCDRCQKWFHISCMGIEEKQVQKIHQFKCPPCQKEITASLLSSVQNGTKIIQIEKEPSAGRKSQESQPSSKKQGNQ